MESITLAPQSSGAITRPAWHEHMKDVCCRVANLTTETVKLERTGDREVSFTVGEFKVEFIDSHRFCVMSLKDAQEALKQLIDAPDPINEIGELKPLAQLLCVNAIWSKYGYNENGPWTSQEHFQPRELKEGALGVLQEAGEKYRPDNMHLLSNPAPGNKVQEDFLKEYVTQQWEDMKAKAKGQAVELQGSIKGSDADFFLAELDDESFNYYTLQNKANSIPAEIELRC